MTDLGPLCYFLGIEVSSTSDGFSISRENYIQDLLARAALDDERTVDTPMEVNVKLRPTDGDPLPDPTRYRHLVGSLVYLAHMDTGYAKHAPGVAREGVLCHLGRTTPDFENLSRLKIVSKSNAPLIRMTTWSDDLVYLLHAGNND
jgi:hypothetical protein